MTIKELFYLAEKRGWENAKILIDYYCDDDWYSIEDVSIKKDNLRYDKRRKEIHITLHS